jgi:hypothetical protein
VGPLSIRFPRLFDICDSKEKSTAQVLPLSPNSLQFRRSFGSEELEAWDLVLQELQQLTLLEAPDSVSWALETSGRFSVSSLYHKINQGPSLPHEKIIRKAKLPLKIKISLWQMAKVKMLASDQIKCCHDPFDGNYALCVQVGIVNHILFSCVLANFVWNGIIEAFGVQWNPSGILAKFESAFLKCATIFLDFICRSKLGFVAHP